MYKWNLEKVFYYMDDTGQLVAEIGHNDDRPPYTVYFTNSLSSMNPPQFISHEKAIEYVEKEFAS